MMMDGGNLVKMSCLIYCNFKVCYTGGAQSAVASINYK